MNEFIQLTCKACGAHEFSENSMGVFTCKYCGANAIFNTDKSIYYNLPQDSNEYKDYLLFCTKLLLNDFNTPNDIFDLKIISISKTKNNETITYTLNFEYKGGNYYIEKSNDHITKIKIPQTPRPQVPYVNKLNIPLILISIILCILFIPVGIILMISTVYSIIRTHNSKVQQIYKTNQKIKLNKLKEFMQAKNL